MDISDGLYVGTLVDYEIKQKFNDDGYNLYCHFDVKDHENRAVHKLALKRELPSASCSASDQMMAITFEFLKVLGFKGSIERLANLADGRSSKVLNCKDYKVEVGTFVVKSEGMPKRHTAINAVHDINSEVGGRSSAFNKSDFLNSLKVGGTAKYLDTKNPWE